MAIELFCPSCGKVLRIPDGCEGMKTKCPECLVDFFIPGAAKNVATTPVCAVLAPAQQKVTADDVERAEVAAARVAAEDLALHIRETELHRQRQRAAARLKLLRMFSKGRFTLDHTVGRIGGFFLAATVGAAMLVVLISVFSPSVVAYVYAAMIGFSLAGLIYVPFSFYPDDDALGPMTVEQTAKLEEAVANHEHIRAEAARLHQQLSAAQAEHFKLKTIFESRLQWLRTCQWEGMTGANFENFLAMVFEERGYLVERMGKVGDQGVDLIIARDGSRVAIQAKGYPGTTVGNAAVQEVHAGMAFHRCQRSVVITNSRFTAAARVLALRIGCHLIDSGQIADLIEGRLLA